MAFSSRNRKRVRIQSGHQERIIEGRRSRPHHRRSRQPSRTIAKKRRIPKMLSTVRRSRHQPHWYCKTHRPTIAEVVYQFLERASNRGFNQNKKNNATNQFRQLQQRSKRLRPDVPMSIKPEIEAMEMPKLEHQFPCSKLPSYEEGKSIEKCIYEVLCFATMLGFLVPADKAGMIFRVSSEIGLFKQENKKNGIKRRTFHDHDHDHDLDPFNKTYCDCDSKSN